MPVSDQPAPAPPSLAPTDVGATGSAPPCPPPIHGDAFKGVFSSFLARGQIIEDYEILRELGVGAFARVYLARQISLDRLVALKVSPNLGREARTLARLEHQHIVQVFSEIVEPCRNLRLLCMQFVPGVTLACLMGALHKNPPHMWNGQTLLAILDELCTEPTPLDLGSLEVRAFLQTCNHEEVTCWLGARLAEALAHAHSQGVIHQDVKPANILINRYGRPFLADFNIALDTRSGEGACGGTLAYMAPEHLEAFLGEEKPGFTKVDARSDMYSLGLVLFECLTGRLPFSQPHDAKDTKDRLHELLHDRQAGAPAPRHVRPETSPLLDRLLSRCLEPAPEKRFSCAENFMHALDGCRDLLQVDQEPDGRLLRACRARPFTMLTLLAVLPHIVGSVVNISYNGLLIIDPAQQVCFRWLILAYNVATYPVLVGLAIWLIGRAYQGWRRMHADPGIRPEEAATIRRQCLALPGWIVVLSCLGWFPGGIVFPAGLSIWNHPLSLPVSIHLFISFLISGLIALTYAYFGVQFIVLRMLYAQLWSDPSGAQGVARQELGGLGGRLRLYQLLAVLIPLLGAVLLISAGPDQFSLTFRLLATSLIVLGLAGFALATRTCNYLSHVLAFFMGSVKNATPFGAENRS